MRGLADSDSDDDTAKWVQKQKSKLQVGFQSFKHKNKYLVATFSSEWMKLEMTEKYIWTYIVKDEND